MKRLFSNAAFLTLIISMVFWMGCDSSSTGSGKNDDPNFNTGQNLVPISGTSADCINGMAADTYPCQDVDLLARVTPSQLMGTELNDIWGWTDPATDKEYALVGLRDRVTFVDISTPEEPVVVGTLPEIDSGSKVKSALHDDEDEGKDSPWRDLKVYNNHAYIVSDGQPHGLQVFDLTRLRDVDDKILIFEEDVHFTGFGNAHNIAINEETGYAYVVGSNQAGGGLYILDLSSPKDPQFVGTHADDTVGRNSTGYVHDTQCVIYSGPDSDYSSQEVCFNSSETHFVIADVSDKNATSTISKATYPGNEYAHQGWLTEDHRYFLLDDELDEHGGNDSTSTYIWNVQDLDSPELVGTYKAPNFSIDHNQYIKGNFSYQANYTVGLRILDLSNISQGDLQEVAFFDTYPSDNSVGFHGAWSNYPFFESGVIIVSDINNGLFILSPNL